MRFIPNVMFAMGMLTLMSGCVERHRTCNSQEMIAMKEKGFSVDDIDNMCTTFKVRDESIKAVADVIKVVAPIAADPFKQNRSGEANSSTGGGQTNLPFNVPAFSSRNATFCATQYGSCPLETRVPTGLPCGCRTPFGAMPGVTQ
ncbi:MAG: hypothetical protein P0120_06440 [Nitrospira sp.]|nr:hypothetical protein [Nitrospira sp.]